MKKQYDSIELIKSFHVKSVFFRYWVKITLLMLMPFTIVTSIISSSYYMAFRNEAMHKIEYSQTEVVNYANLTLQRLDEYTENISLSTEFHRFLYLSDITKLSLSDANDLSILRRYLRVQQISSSDAVINVSVYSFKNDYIISTGKCDFLNNFDDITWHGYFIANKKQKYIIPSEDGTLFVCSLIGSPISPNGMIIYEISPLKLLNPTNDPIIEQFDFTFLNSYNQCIFTTTDLDLAAVYNELETEKPNFESSTLKTKKEKRFIYTEADINANFLYIRVNPDVFINKKSLTLTIVLLVFLLIILTPLIISFSISWYFYRELLAIMQTLSPTENIYSVTKNANNEITFIINNIAKMQDDNTLLRETITEKVEELKTLQASVLQLQLNPHFLFNALNSINIVVMKLAGYKNLASTMIIHLSQLLRIALDTNNYIVSFEDEINYSKKYIKIEEIQTQNGFDTFWEVDDALLTWKTPKLIMQPIIENAFTHGIKHLDSDIRGILNISVKEHSGNAVISITNNGPEIPSGELNSINSDLKSGRPSTPDHVGLNNINRRIQLLFGKNYGCFIRSNPGKTTVEITIPKILNFTDTEENI